jgi:hypothetical protein
LDPAQRTGFGKVDIEQAHRAYLLGDGVGWPRSVIVRTTTEGPLLTPSTTGSSG